MAEIIVQYVPHDRVKAFEAQGWEVSDGDVPCHHSRWSRIMRWRGAGEPPTMEAPAIAAE